MELHRLITGQIHSDERGNLKKITSQDLPFETKEFFSSTNKKDVLRGFHFQIPPWDHEKVVACLRGRILDVIIDLRSQSPSRNQCFAFEMSENDGRFLYIPKGYGHAFLSLEEGSVIQYFQSNLRHPESEKGVLWSSVSFRWPVKNPVLSVRDQGFPAIDADPKVSYF